MSGLVHAWMDHASHRNGKIIGKKYATGNVADIKYVLFQR